MAKMTMVEAINLALREEMARDERVIVLGEDVGMAVAGLRPVCEMQFSGFAYHAFHQIETHISRLRRGSQGAATMCPW